jgi:thiol-disulfide isomerase/thioredoxin
MMAAVKLNDGDTIYAQLREIKVTPQNAVSLGSYFGGTFHHYVLNAKGPEACLEIIAGLEAAIPDGPFPSDEVRKSNGWARRQLADAKSVYLAESGRYTEALKAIDAAMAALDDDVYRKKDLLGTRRRYELIGQPAPALTVDRWHGDYRGLEAYRGKVLMLEFTAHWCHACHAALPALRKLYAELRDREFEIVSVTTYYGYFYPDNVQKKDMPRDVEFARMPKMLKEQGVTWPMVYTDRATMTAYGVTGIPHLILLDKKGIIRRVDLGFSDAKMGRFKTLLATLLAE